MNLAVVIPTYNEKDTLPILIKDLINELKKILEKFSILIMDDASPDGTGQIAEELKNHYGDITVIHRKTKLGLGSAYKDGFRLALEKFEPDLIIQMDADYSHNPHEIPQMIHRLREYDFGVASRHVPGSSIVGWGTYRKALHTAAGLLAAACGGIKISDSTSGFRIFKREVLNSIDFSKIKSDGFAFQIEILCMLKRMGYKGLEFPTRFVNRGKGYSKMGITESFEFLKTCLNLLARRI